MKSLLATLGIAMLLVGVLSDVPQRRGFSTVAFVAAAPPQQTASRTPAPRQKKLFPPQDLGLLSAPDRDDWSKPDLIMDVLGIADGAVVADLGAGGGWFTIRLARRVGPNGLVYAQDIQPQMIEAINRRVQQEGLTNVRTVLGTPTDPRLPGGLDAVLIVDAYREMDEPGKPEVLQDLLQRIDDASWTWETSLMGVALHGAELFHFAVGPQLGAEGAAGGVLRVRPGVTFPRHSHHGSEITYVLDGGYVADGRSYGPGTQIEVIAGTAHDYRSAPGRDLVLIVLHHGITMLRV